jgi:hypothetical protein
MAVANFAMFISYCASSYSPWGDLNWSAEARQLKYERIDRTKCGEANTM